jgi:hypothetical protein
MDFANANQEALLERIRELEQQIAELRSACEAWLLVESEARENNPCPDLGLRARYRQTAIALTQAALRLEEV